MFSHNFYIGPLCSILLPFVTMCLPMFPLCWCCDAAPGVPSGEGIGEIGGVEESLCVGKHRGQDKFA